MTAGKSERELIEERGRRLRAAVVSAELERVRNGSTTPRPPVRRNKNSNSGSVTPTPESVRAAAMSKMGEAEMTQQNKKGSTSLSGDTCKTAAKIVAGAVVGAGIIAGAVRSMS